MRYRVYDIYDGKELLGKCETIPQAKKLANERDVDTDGECCIILYDLVEDEQITSFRY